MRGSSTVTRMLGLTVLAAILLSCAEASPIAEQSEPVLDADIYGGFPIDPPGADEIVLTLDGATIVELTMSDLEALAERDVTFVEPFVKVEQTFRVLALSALFELAGIAPSDTVDTIALNDYRFRSDVAALLEADALLAIGRDGSPIPMDAGGPVRIVFEPTSGYHGFLDAWNWSLRTVRVVAEP